MGIASTTAPQADVAAAHWPPGTQDAWPGSSGGGAKQHVQLRQPARPRQASPRTNLPATRRTGLLRLQRQLLLLGKLLRIRDGQIILDQGDRYQVVLGGLPNGLGRRAVTAENAQGGARDLQSLAGSLAAQLGLWLHATPPPASLPTPQLCRWRHHNGCPAAESRVSRDVAAQPYQARDHRRTLLNSSRNLLLDDLLDRRHPGRNLIMELGGGQCAQARPRRRREGRPRTSKEPPPSPTPPARCPWPERLRQAAAQRAPIPFSFSCAASLSAASNRTPLAKLGRAWTAAILVPNCE